MAKFCTQCGRRLAEGEVCNCRSQHQGQGVSQQTIKIEADAGKVESQQIDSNLQGTDNNSGSIPQTAQNAAEPKMQNLGNGFQQQRNNNYAQQSAQNSFNGENQGFVNNAQPQFNNTYNQQSAQYGAQPGYNNGQQYNNRNWQNEMGQQTIAGAKNLFSRFINMFVSPVSGASELAMYGSSMPGIGFMIIKALILTAIFIFGAKKIEEIGYGYVEIPYVRLIILSLLITVGADMLEAFLLKVLASAFRVKAELRNTFSSVSVRVVYEIALMIVFLIIFKLSIGLAFTVYAAGSIILPFAEYAAYNAQLAGDDNKKLFAFYITKLCITLLLYIVVKNIGLDIFIKIAGGTYSNISSMLGNVFNDFMYY